MSWMRATLGLSAVAYLAFLERRFVFVPDDRRTPSETRELGIRSAHYHVPTHPEGPDGMFNTASVLIVEGA